MSEHEDAGRAGDEEPEQTVDDLDVPEKQGGDVTGGFIKWGASDDSVAKK